MSDRLGAQKSPEWTFDGDIEVITPRLEKIQFTNSGSMVLVRPDKLRAHRVGGCADVELVFDGKTASVDGRSLDAYAQLEMPDTVDQIDPSPAPSGSPNRQALSALPDPASRTPAVR